MKIPELLDLIEKLVNDEYLTKKEKNSLAANIKKQYGIIIKDLKANRKKSLNKKFKKFKQSIY